MWYPMSTPPAGWLECNGQGTGLHTELAKIVGSTVPDLRGEFIRGWDHGRGVDNNRAFASWQKDTLADHKHFQGAGVEYYNLGAFANNAGWRDVSTYESGRSYYAWTSGAYTTDGTAITSTETKPRNLALLPCIKY